MPKRKIGDKVKIKDSQYFKDEVLTITSYGKTLYGEEGYILHSGIVWFDDELEDVSEDGNVIIQDRKKGGSKK